MAKQKREVPPYLKRLYTQTREEKNFFKKSMEKEKKQMKKQISEAIERNFETDNKEIARLISEGNTSGLLDSGDGYGINWSLNVNKFEY